MGIWSFFPKLTFTSDYRVANSYLCKGNLTPSWLWQKMKAMGAFSQFFHGLFM